MSPWACRGHPVTNGKPMRLVVPRHAGGPRVRPLVATSPAERRTNAAWLRDQVSALRMRLTFGPGMLDLGAICRALAAIERGEDHTTDR